ncbi:MAG: DNA-3-methyladenine glycosylase family protein [Oscillospiraceae bacterium]
MEGFEKGGVLLPAAGMNLEATLFCGQSFVWQKSEDGGFVGVAGGRAAAVYERGENFLLLPLGAAPPGEGDLAFWHHYFALETNYPALLARFAKSKKLAACVAAAPGIRVLHQPFFETLVCFIISQNNHIPRITGIVQRLCRLFGKPLAGGLYAFPTPGVLAALTVEDLAPLRAGFRAKYIVDAAQKVAGGLVTRQKLEALPTAEARALLATILGVGTKVADCVLLYSLGRNEVVPMDVWMKRAMAQLFPKSMPAAARGHEGIAQQFIFCWARQNLH